MEYRSADARDALAIAGLHADSWRRNYRGAYSDAFLDGDVGADRVALWTDRLTDIRDDRFTILAQRGRDVVGFIHTALDADPAWGALVDNLHVAHELKRSGIGRRLMGEAAATILQRRPGEGLYLWVLEQNEPAQSFYAALSGRCVEQAFADPPGDDLTRLNGTPVKFRIAWADPAALLQVLS